MHFKYTGPISAKFNENTMLAVDEEICSYRSDICDVLDELYRIDVEIESRIKPSASNPIRVELKDEKANALLQKLDVSCKQLIETFQKLRSLTAESETEINQLLMSSVHQGEQDCETSQ